MQHKNTKKLLFKGRKVEKNILRDRAIKIMNEQAVKNKTQNIFLEFFHRLLQISCC